MPTSCWTIIPRARTLDQRVREGFDTARDYYFFAVRAMIEQYRIAVSAFDIAGRAWQEIDRAEHIAAARARLHDPEVAIDRRELGRAGAR
jgi:hypothetical protein